jgi:hypothetical protein
MEPDYRIIALLSCVAWTFCLSLPPPDLCVAKRAHSSSSVIFLLYPISLHVMSTSWDNSRRHARALETALDAKLSGYSKLAGKITRVSGLPAVGTSQDPNHDDEGEGGYKLIEEEIEELLGKVSLAQRTCRISSRCASWNKR